MTRYVAQEHPFGCAVACLAMIVGKTYGEMLAWLDAEGQPAVQRAKGLTAPVYCEALARHGCAVAQRHLVDTLTNERRASWPLAPFAPLHIAETMVSAGGHAVVMLADGTVLDPFDATRTSIAHPDYRQVNTIIGIWKVAP
jgi:hypothetical protein